MIAQVIIGDCAYWPGPSSGFHGPSTPRRCRVPKSTLLVRMSALVLVLSRSCGPAHAPLFLPETGALGATSAVWYEL